MGMEDKKDNKIDTGRNGRPINLNLGGEDLLIDLPNAIPGQEDTDLEEASDDKLDEILADLNDNYKKIENLLKDIGIDDIDKFTSENLD